MKLLIPNNKDILLICGPYKTGTSLLAYELEKNGFFNPSTISNPNEFGHGRKDNYYSTKECVEVRRINNRLIAKRHRRFRYIPDSINIDILNYINEFDVSVILKDPLFVFTLNVWLYNLYFVRRKVIVYFTFRNKAELIKSWLHAYHTKGLFKDNNEIIDQMILFQTYQLWNCKQYKIPFELYFHQPVIQYGIQE